MTSDSIWGVERKSGWLEYFCQISILENPEVLLASRYSLLYKQAQTGSMESKQHPHRGRKALKFTRERVEQRKSARLLLAQPWVHQAKPLSSRYPLTTRKLRQGELSTIAKVTRKLNSQVESKPKEVILPPVSLANKCVRWVWCHHRLLETWKTRLCYTEFTCSVEGFSKPRSVIWVFTYEKWAESYAFWEANA